MQKRLLLKKKLAYSRRKSGGKKIRMTVNKMKCMCLMLIKFGLCVYGVYRLEMFDKAGVYVQRFFTTVERST